MARGEHELLEPSFRGEAPHQFGHEEGIAAGSLEECGARVLGHPFLFKDAHGELPALGPVERAKLDEKRALVAAHGLDQARHGIAVAPAALHVGSRDHQARGGTAVEDVLDRFQRGIGQMQVFEQEDERLRGGQAPDRAREQVEGESAVFAPRRDQRLRFPARGLGDLREENAQFRKKVAQGLRGAGRIGVDVFAEGLAESLIRQGGINPLDKAAMKHESAATLRHALEFAQEGGLAEPLLAADQRQLRLPRLRAVEGLHQVFDLVAPSHDRGPGARDHDRGGERRLRIPEAPRQLAQHAADLVAVLGPGRGRFGHAGEDDVLGLHVDEGGEEAGRLGLGVHDLVEHGLGVAGEGELAGEGLEHHDPERIDVGGGRTRRVQDRLGRQIGESADDDVGLRHARVLGPEGDAEIHQLRAPLLALARDHDVLGLDVAMDDPALVRVVESLGHLRADIENLVGLERLFLLHRAKRLPLDVGHDEEQVPLVVGEVVDRNDAGVVEFRDGAGLALEPLPLISLQIAGGQHLDRDLALQHRIARQIHHSHASSTDLSEDFVSRSEFSTDHRLARRSRPSTLPGVSMDRTG